MILYSILEGISFAARSLPAIVPYSLAGAFGDAAYSFWPRGRRNMLKSIAAVLCQDVSSPEVRRNARRGLRNYYKSNVDIIRYAHARKNFFEQDIDLIGTENLDEALSEGKGAIIVGFHMGNLDLGVRALGNAGYAINAIVQKLDLKDIDRFIQKARAASGVKLVYEDEDIFNLINVLKRNEIVALMIDGRCYEKGVLVRLGNKSIIVPSGMALLSLRTGARVLPCCLVRSSNTRFHGIVGKPVPFKSTGDLAEDTVELSQSTVQALEEMARTFPDQWYIFHNLIKDDVVSPQVMRKTREPRKAAI